MPVQDEESEGEDDMARPPEPTKEVVKEEVKFKIDCSMFVIGSNE